jgi:WD40 repeat protein
MKEGADVLEGIFTVDSAKVPKQLLLRSLDARGRETVLRIAFSLKDDRLVLCFDPRPGATAPEVIETKEGDGRFLITLQSLLVRQFQGHTGPVHRVCFSPDGKRAVSGSGWPWGDRTIRLWEVATGREVREIPTASVVVKPKGCNPREVPGEVLDVALSQDAARVFACGCGGFVGTWDASTGALTRAFAGHERTATAMALSSDRHRVLSGGCDNLVRLWDVDRGTELKQLKGHTSWVRTVAFAPDGRRALSAGIDQTLRLWDLETGQELQRMTHDGWVWSVVFLPDGKRAMSAGGVSRKPESEAEDESAEVEEADLRPRGPVILWDLETGRVLRRYQGHRFGVNSVALSPDGRHAVTGGYDNTVRLWNVETGAELCRYLGHREWVWSVAFAPDGRQVLSAGGGYGTADTVAPGKDFALRLWRVP